MALVGIKLGFMSKAMRYLPTVTPNAQSAGNLSPTVTAISKVANAVVAVGSGHPWNNGDIVVVEQAGSGIGLMLGIGNSRRAKTESNLDRI